MKDGPRMRIEFGFKPTASKAWQHRRLHSCSRTVWGAVLYAGYTVGMDANTAKYGELLMCGDIGPMGSLVIIYLEFGPTWSRDHLEKAQKFLQENEKVLSCHLTYPELCETMTP